MRSWGWTGLIRGAATAFLLEMSRRYSTGSMKGVTSGQRALLRFLFAAGDVDRDLSLVVPSVAGWRLSALPVGADDDTVTALLASCDRATPVGLRDRAVLLLMGEAGAAGGGSRAKVDLAALEAVVRPWPAEGEDDSAA